jgi:hypothetical protein
MIMITRDTWARRAQWTYTAVVFLWLFFIFGVIIGPPHLNDWGFWFKLWLDVFAAILMTMTGNHCYRKSREGLIPRPWYL